MNVCIHWPWWSILGCRYSAPKDETKFPIGIKSGFDKINICTQTVSVPEVYLSNREGTIFSARRGKKKGKIIRNWADGVNFQSCVWESSIQIPLTNNSQRSRLLLTGLWKQVCISPVALALMCPWCCPGSFWAGWHLHNTMGPNMPLHLEQSSLSTDRNRNTSTIEVRLCVHHICLWVQLREGTEIICKEIYIIIDI